MQCLYGCSCHRSPSEETNIFDCYDTGLTHIPQTVVNETDSVILAGNNLGDLSTVENYLYKVKSIDMSSSNVQSITDDVMTAMLTNVKHVDISNNSLTFLPRTITDVKNRTQLMIGNNPYECNCDMMWMRDWLVQATNVIDKENAICAAGNIKGGENTNLHVDLHTKRLLKYFKTGI